MFTLFNSAQKNLFSKKKNTKGQNICNLSNSNCTWMPSRQQNVILCLELVVQAQTIAEQDGTILSIEQDCSKR